MRLPATSVQWARFALITTAVLIAARAATAQETFVRSETQYIAALNDPNSTSGTDAETWGLWEIDPGPRGIKVSQFERLLASHGIAPAGWRFDNEAWWIEEHGLIMEAPSFPLQPGRYVVTGGREVTTVLTVEPPDTSGRQAWSLADGATIYDVTHLRCRAALYQPKEAGKSCLPDAMPTHVFPMSPGIAMPFVDGCSKRDYQVLIVLGMMVEG